MHEQEIKVLWRGGTLLAVASLFRFFAGGSVSGTALQTPSVLDSLLVASQVEGAAEAERTRALEPGERINPNVASADELTRLPGIGPSLAARIVAARTTGGEFRTMNELTRVNGIGPKTLERLHLRLDLPKNEAPQASPPSPRPGSMPPKALNPRSVAGLNRASVSELERLPGVGPVLAVRIEQHRREHGPFDSVEDLIHVPGIGPAKMAVLRAFLGQRGSDRP